MFFTGLALKSAACAKFVAMCAPVDFALIGWDGGSGCLYIWRGRNVGVAEPATVRRDDANEMPLSL